MSLLGTQNQPILSKKLSFQTQLSDKLKLVKVLAGAGVTACGVYSLHQLLGKNEYGCCIVCCSLFLINNFMKSDLVMLSYFKKRRRIKQDPQCFIKLEKHSGDFQNI